VSKPRKSKELRAQLRSLLDAKLLRQMTVIGAMSDEGKRIRAERGVVRPPEITIPEVEEGVTE